eukprot:TRINITY_DN11972_c0_g1_i2.p2 TRINITY_DN11972_c0_g1~~TRINITY_DN11972_c0_g1_i2.p2  ORF type:complete len:451 (+),score=53.54 TRINITY_DN11972_c0_g1_i2:91-1353(+)
MITSTSYCISCKRLLKPTITGRQLLKFTTNAESELSAKDVVINYYTAYNKRDFSKAVEYIADDCVYEDLIYEYPFEGKEAIKEYFKKVAKLVPDDLKFEIEDIPEGDPRKVGVQWYTSIDGKFFPFSRGCSFYRTNDKGQIVFARDIVEPQSKPGASTLNLLNAIAPVIRILSKRVDFRRLDMIPTKSYAVWFFYIGYISILIFSTIAPGYDTFHQPPEVFARLLHESLNFFYVNIGLNNIGITFVPSIAEHPADEAFFNFIAAWGVSFLPFMLANPKSKKLGSKVIPLWIGTEFLTNIVFLPFLALMLAPETEDVKNKNDFVDVSKWKFPSWSNVCGITTLVLGGLSMAWAVFARPEYGDFDQRLQFMVNSVMTDRVAFAFAVDFVLYTFWQAFVLMPEAPLLNRFVPLFGMGVYLLGK